MIEPDLPGLGPLIELLGRIEGRAIPLLERIALALERGGGPAAAGPAPTTPEDHRRAVAERRWEDARSIARELAEIRPGDPVLAELVAEGEAARASASAEIRARIESARGANDPTGVLDGRDELERVEGEAWTSDLDPALARWLLGAIHRRLRAGSIQAETVALADRVARRFAATAEGASLAASLPTLRRSAKLCARCGEPYSGLAEACPRCLGPAFEEPPELDLGFAGPATSPVEASSPATIPIGSADGLDLDLVGEPYDLDRLEFGPDPDGTSPD